MKIQFWVEGAREVGACHERGCGGRMLVVENMGRWTWAQCNRCYKEAGVGHEVLPERAPAGAAAGEPADPGKVREFGF